MSSRLNVQLQIKPGADDVDKVRELSSRWQKNPQLFKKQVLGGPEWWSKQIEIIESVRDNRDTYVRSCHGVGKTFSEADVILWFLYSFFPSKVITTAPSWAQVEKLLWSEVNSKFRNARIKLWGECLNTEIKIRDDWFALGLSPKMDVSDLGNRFVGFHSPNLLIVFDEAPAVQGKLWKIKEALMTSENVKFLGVGNPVADNGDFFEGFRKEGTSKISMSIFDSPNFKANGITMSRLKELARLDYPAMMEECKKMACPFPALTTPRWAVERLKEWGEDSPIFISRVIGDFPKTSIDTIISLAALERCKDCEPTGKHPAVLGVDVARFGNDNTCIFGLRNYRQVMKDQWNGMDLVQTTGRIKEAITEHGFRIVVIDDTGLGGGVTDMLVNDPSLEGVTILPVNFAEGAMNKDVYDGIVTEMYFKAKELFESDEIQVEDTGKLFQQLSSRKSGYITKRGSGVLRRIESKDDFKKRTGQGSPDEADACILAIRGTMTGSGEGMMASDDGAGERW